MKTILTNVAKALVAIVLSPFVLFALLLILAFALACVVVAIPMILAFIAYVIYIEETRY